MKELIMTGAGVLLAITLISSSILGNKPNTLQGAVGEVMSKNVSRMQRIP